MSSNNILFDITPLEKKENSNKYKINMSFPIELGWIEDVNFVIEKGNRIIPYKLKHLKNEDGKVYFEGEVELETRAIYRYYFSYLVDGITNFLKKEYKNNEHITKDEMWKMSVNFDTPKWAKGKVMYHIFVDRFNKGRDEELVPMPRRTIHKSWDEDMVIGPNEDKIWNADFYGGDLQGIIEKLDYLKSLGIDILYLSPIVHSQSNHRYDTSDYENVDPYVGTNDDLKRLCDEAHKRGMKIVLDAVFNHTGNDSKYFNEYESFPNVGAYQSKDSQYAKFYREKEINGKRTFDYWWGMKNLPVCNGDSKEWQDYILGENGIIDKWFSLGIDGLRLDVADELTDDFIEKIRIAVKRNKEDGFILGEVWKNPMRMNRSYIESGKGMDSVMNYSLIDALIRYFKYGDVDKLAYIIKDIKNEYPKETIDTLMNFTSTHDISRAINIFSSNNFQEYGEWSWNPENNDLEYCKNFKLSPEEYEKGKELYEAYVFALTFMPGILSIFYGDEVGIQGLGNLANRKTFPWGSEDKELLEYFRNIILSRKKEEFLQEADIDILEINKDYLMFERMDKENKALFAVNRTNEEKELNIPSEYEESKDIYTLKKSRKTRLSPYGGIAIKK